MVWGGPKALRSRLRLHEAGRGARLMEVVTEAGIPWHLARVWHGGPARERSLKNQGGASRRCPDCGVKPRVRDVIYNRDGSVSRSLTPAVQLECLGLMSALQLREHTELRRDLIPPGPVAGLTHLRAGDPRLDEAWWNDMSEPEPDLDIPYTSLMVSWYINGELFYHEKTYSGDEPLPRVEDLIPPGAEIAEVEISTPGLAMRCTPGAAEIIRGHTHTITPVENLKTFLASKEL
jgi:hypothetical protein